MMIAGTPRRASWLASISPVGPAPMIRTSVSIINYPSNGLLEFPPRRPTRRRGTIRMINDALLKSVYLFAELDASQRAEFARIAEVLALPAEHTIFDLGDPATALFLIQEGTVRITTTSAGAHAIDVATLGPGS